MQPLTPSAPHPPGLEAAAWLRASGSATRDREGGEKEAATAKWKGWSRRPKRVVFETLCALLDLFHGEEGQIFGCVWFVWFHSGSGDAEVSFQCPPCSEQLTLLGFLCSANSSNLKGRSSPNSPPLAALYSFTG